jgi:hypothetical protein
MESAFAAASFNLGPNTTCRPHLDGANLPFGWCGVTPFGSYDPTREGHLVLHELKLVIEFPPGSTILLPSSIITHSNTPILEGSTRYSFTQYSAGELFRFVDNGFRTDKKKFGSVPRKTISAYHRKKGYWERGVRKLRKWAGRRRIAASMSPPLYF